MYTETTVTFSWTGPGGEQSCHNSCKGKKLTDVASETKARGTQWLLFEPFSCPNNEATRESFHRSDALIAAGFQPAAVHDKWKALIFVCACLIVVRWKEKPMKRLQKG